MTRISPPVPADQTLIRGNQRSEIDVIRGPFFPFDVAQEMTLSDSRQT
jgi:hypothetical protein